jgi:GDPmannose 4,6-dehydratase
MGQKALICGVSGQDGAYLAESLLNEGYEVCGTSRDAQIQSFPGLTRLGIKDRLRLESMIPTDFRSVIQVVLSFQPDEIYNLSGQSSVGLSFQQPVETFHSIAEGTINLLEAIKLSGRKTRFYNASSGECFGNLFGEAANELTPFRPRSPYAIAKASAHWIVENYREAYQLFACSGILFNHESPLRPDRFVTRKIVVAALEIKAGCRRKLKLGNLKVFRDWGWAPDYVEAMKRMMRRDQPEDFVIATGVAHSLEEFVEGVFSRLDLDWKESVEIDPSLLRPTDLSGGKGNSFKAHSLLGWKPTILFPELLDKLIAGEQATIL